MENYLNANNARQIWDAVKEKIDEKNSDSIISWDNIDGRPDLSNIATINTAVITLASYAWNGNVQTVEINGILEDEANQLIIPIPFKNSKDIYEQCHITCIDQKENGLTFHSDATPEENVDVAIYIFGVSEINEIPAVEFVWWSPKMTSSTSPAPFVVSASSDFPQIGGGLSFNAFDNNLETFWSCDGTHPTWIQFDFGKIVPIDGISICPRKGYRTQLPSSGSIQGSINGSDWDDVLLLNKLAPNNNPVEYMFDILYRYKYIRLYNLKSTYGGGDYSSISDIQFHVPEGSL